MYLGIQSVDKFGPKAMIRRRPTTLIPRLIFPVQPWLTCPPSNPFTSRCRERHESCHQTTNHSARRFNPHNLTGSEQRCRMNAKFYWISWAGVDAERPAFSSKRGHTCNGLKTHPSKLALHGMLLCRQPSLARRRLCSVRVALLNMYV